MISPAAPDTLLLGIWSAAGHAAATAALRNWQGETLPVGVSFPRFGWRRR
jgi:hypothetical protein